MTSENPAEQKRRKAQSHFEKSEERKREAARSMADQQREKNAEIAKTARLRALRLAKEAADLQAAQAKKQAALDAPAKTGPRKASTRKKALADT